MQTGEETEFERRRDLIRRFRLENDRDPDDMEYLDIIGSVRIGSSRKRPWRWP